MEHSCKYLIVGGGMTADAAVRGIREKDKEGMITVLSAEEHPPYNRPPLSKKLWLGEPVDSIWCRTEKADVDLRLGTSALSGDPAMRSITDSHGDIHTYEKLLLATGGAPRHLPFSDEEVIYFRTFDDYEKVRALAEGKAEFIVIGGGFIGSEIAAALTINNCMVTMIFPDSGIGARIYPPDLSSFLNSVYREKGVTLLPGENVTGIERTGMRSRVMTDSGKVVQGDVVIAGIGIEPNTALAQSLGLTVENGIIVDEFLRTVNPEIYAAGDVANFHSPVLGVRRRVEHEDNATIMGRTAGYNMAGGSEKYEHLPFFYSDLFDLGYEAVGEFGSDMDIVEDWTEPFRKGVVYYLRDEEVRGVLLWNTWDQVDTARTLIGARQKLGAEDLKGRISD